MHDFCALGLRHCEGEVEVGDQLGGSWQDDVGWATELFKNCCCSYSTPQPCEANHFRGRSFSGKTTTLFVVKIGAEGGEEEVLMYCCHEEMSSSRYPMFSPIVAG